MNLARKKLFGFSYLYISSDSNARGDISGSNILQKILDNSCRFSSFAKSILGGIVLLDNLIRNVVRVFYYIEKINFEMHTNICVRWSLITLHLL